MTENVGRVAVLRCEAIVPALDDWKGRLYCPADETETEAAEITAVPYYA